MTVKIRAASPQDAERLSALHVSCFEQSWDALSFRQLLEQPGAFAFVGSAAATELQGFIVLQLAADECEILTLGTAPDARRQGLARALVIEALGEAGQRGVLRVFLEVAENNAPAISLYQNLGFVVVGRRRDYYVMRDGAHDALMLRRDLPLRSGGNAA